MCIRCWKSYSWFMISNMLIAFHRLFELKTLFYITPIQLVTRKRCKINRLRVFSLRLDSMSISIYFSIESRVCFALLAPYMSFGVLYTFQTKFKTHKALIKQISSLTLYKGQNVQVHVHTQAHTHTLQLF